MNRVTSLVIFLLVAVCSFFAVAGNQGLLHLGQLNGEMAELERKNRQIESEIAGLRNKIYAVEKSDEVLESTAREDLGLSKPGEIVYIFSEPRQTSPDVHSENDQAAKETRKK